MRMKNQPDLASGCSCTSRSGVGSRKGTWTPPAAAASAAEVLGSGVVSGAPRHLYLAAPSPAGLEGLGLVPCRPGEPPELLVRRPASSQAVLRAAIRPEGELPVADAVQCWLDLRHHPVRGKEQAAAIARRLDWDR